MGSETAGRGSIPINLPNILSLVRVLLTPLFAILLIKHRLGGALLVFVIAALSDCLDGLSARVFRQFTTLGSYLDPAADKMLLVTAFVTLGIQGLMPSWLAVIVISRDVLILCGVALLTILGHTFHPKPSVMSKITTVAQIATVSLVLTGAYFQWTAPHFVWQLLFWFTAGMTMISGFQYIYRGLNLLQEES